VYDAKQGLFLAKRNAEQGMEAADLDYGSADAAACSIALIVHCVGDVHYAFAINDPRHGGARFGFDGSLLTNPVGERSMTKVRSVMKGRAVISQ
jgi:hypothetical protein